MSHTAPTVSQSIEIAADPSVVYSLVTDLATLANLAEETHSMLWKKGHRATPGAVFTGSNANGAKKWTTRCTVTDAVPGRMFAFEVDLPIPFSKIARWQYDILAEDGGCRVTESTWDRRSRVFGVIGKLTTGTEDRVAVNKAHIAATLDRLKARAEA